MKAGHKRAVVGSMMSGLPEEVMAGLTGKDKGVYKCLNYGKEFED